MRYKLLLIVFCFSLLALNGYTQQHFLAGQLGDSVIYTDINPDKNVSLNSQYLMDIDNNGVNDFKITQTIIDGPAMTEAFIFTISGLNKNKILYYTVNMALSPYAGSQCGLIKIAKIFNYGDSIFMQKDTCKEAYLWYGILDGYGQCSANDWLGIGPKYIGIVLNRNDSLTYGWIKVDVPFGITVMEYASNLKSFTQAQYQYSENSIKIFPNPVKDFLYLFLPFALDGNQYNLNLMNDLGVSLIKKKVGGINYKLDMSKLVPGTYLLVISDHSKIYFKQKILKR
jgi:hypothetical protein